MASKRQIRANRRNARRSTGPRTAAGKAASAANALRHGLAAARTVVLPDEDAGAFARFRHDVIADLDPQDTLQAALAGRIALLLWRLDRAARLEAELFVHGHLAGQRNRLSNAAYRGAVEGALAPPGAGGSGDRLSEARRAIDEEILMHAPSAKVLAEREGSARIHERLARHEGALQRALTRTLEEFRRLRGTKEAAPADADPDAEDVPPRGARGDSLQEAAEAAEAADAAAEAEPDTGDEPPGGARRDSLREAAAAAGRTAGGAACDGENVFFAKRTQFAATPRTGTRVTLRSRPAGGPLRPLRRRTGGRCRPKSRRNRLAAAAAAA